MNKDLQRDFARRISQANKTELIVVTYDIILEELKEARLCLDGNDVEGYRRALKKAQRFLGEVMAALDFKYDIARRLMSLYEYVQRILVASDISGTDRGLENAEGILIKLRGSFADIAEQDASGAVMENTQTVYAGLTYGRGSLNEMNLSEGSNRGFLA